MRKRKLLNKLLIPCVAIVVVGIGFLILIFVIKGQEGSITGGDTIVVDDFSNKTSAEVMTWCAENNATCSITTEFSETVEQGEFISQSVAAGQTTSSHNTINIIYSQGIIPQEGRYGECVKAVSDYVNRDHMSYATAYDFFLPEYGEDVTRWSVDHVNIDWHTIALARAVDLYNEGTTDMDTIQSTLHEEQFSDEEVGFALDNLEGTLGN